MFCTKNILMDIYVPIIKQEKEDHKKIFSFHKIISIKQTIVSWTVFYRYFIKMSLLFKYYRTVKV